MGTCDYCGKDEAMPYRCKYCGGTFCAAHRLPENHECKGILSGKPTIEITYPNTLPTEEKTTSSPVNSPTKSNNILTVLVVLLCIAGLGISWSYADSLGFETGYSEGYSDGETNGKQVGYTLGYAEGIISGNITGLRGMSTKTNSLNNMSNI